MKKLLCVLFAVLLLCGSLIPVCAANRKISVKTVSSASVGDTITVSVNLSANSNLGGLELTVKFDNSAFQLVGSSTQVTGLFSFADKKESTSSIKYAGMTADAVNSSGTLFTFKLKVLKVGGKITVSVDEAIDGNDEFVTSSVSTSGATVKCSHANMKWDVVKKATCTEKGEKKGTCACGYTATETIKKTDHTYGKWVVEKEATETEKGLKSAVCSVCGDKKEQSIPVIKTTTTSESTTEKTETNETTTFVEQTTETTTLEESTKPTNVDVENPSTTSIVVKTVAVVLGVEALGLLVFFVIKKKKQK